MPPGWPRCLPPPAAAPKRATAFDFGFALGPRLNAAGRLSDMTLGIECLLHRRRRPRRRTGPTARRHQPRAPRPSRAACANRPKPCSTLLARGWQAAEPPPALCVFDPDFPRRRGRHRRLAPEGPPAPPHLRLRRHGAVRHGHELKGSGRSIPGFHLRDALDLVAKRCPGVLLRFGGHAMAAGCTHRRRPAGRVRGHAAARSRTSGWTPPP
jgi:single-stranded-DNA-specific exonuclease